MMKKREREDTDSVGQSNDPLKAKSNRKGSNQGLGNTSGMDQSAYTSTLEARLNNLESLLRSIPPNVHNALISRLDGELAVGPPGSRGLANQTSNLGSNQIQGMGFGNQMPNINEGNVSGQLSPNQSFGSDLTTGMPTLGNIDMDLLRSLAGSSTSHYDPSNLNENMTNHFNGMSNAPSGTDNLSGLGNYHLGNLMSNNGVNKLNTRTRDSFGGDINLVRPEMSALSQARSRSMDRRVGADPMGDLESRLQDMNLSNGYLYVDEIGQTKWQGESGIL